MGLRRSRDNSGLRRIIGTVFLYCSAAFPTAPDMAAAQRIRPRPTDRDPEERPRTCHLPVACTAPCPTRRCPTAQRPWVRVMLVLALVSSDLYHVSKSSAIRWVRRERETGSAAALPMGGRGRLRWPASVIGRWVGRLRSGTSRCASCWPSLSDRGIAVSYYALSHILDDAGISFKEKPARQRTGPAGRRAPARTVAAISGQDRPQPAGVHR